MNKTKTQIVDFTSTFIVGAADLIRKSEIAAVRRYYKQETEGNQEIGAEFILKNGHSIVTTLNFDEVAVSLGLTVFQK